MKATKKKSIELLNQAAADELAAVHQYMYFHFHCDDQGYDLLAALFKTTAIEEMLHVERLADRILFLKGDVELIAAGEPRKITDVKQMLEVARAMEEHSVRDYNAWANECSANADCTVSAKPLGAARTPAGAAGVVTVAVIDALDSASPFVAATR